MQEHNNPPRELKDSKEIATLKAQFAIQHNEWLQHPMTRALVDKLEQQREQLIDKIEEKHRGISDKEVISTIERSGATKQLINIIINHENLFKY